MSRADRLRATRLEAMLHSLLSIIRYTTDDPALPELLASLGRAIHEARARNQRVVVNITLEPVTFYPSLSRDRG